MCIQRLGLLTWLLFLLLFSSTSAKTLDQDGGQSTLQDLLMQALTKNPQLKAAVERQQMTEARARQQGLLDDPMGMVKLQNGLVSAPLSLDSEPSTAIVLGINQNLPFSGKLGLRRQEADLESEQERWKVLEQKLEITRSVKETWFRISAVDRAMDAVEKNIGALEDLLIFSETMYGVGQGLQQDVLDVQLARAKMEETRINLQERRQSLVAAMNVVTFRPVDTAIPVIPPGDLPVLTFHQNELEELAFANRPILKALDTRLAQTGIKKRLADKNNYPDFNLAFEYMQREPTATSEGDDMYSATLSFSLPVQRQRIEAQAAEAMSEHRLVQQEIEDLRNGIRLAIADSLAALERNKRLVDLYQKGLLEQTVAVHETAIATYRAGKTDFTRVLNTKMAVFNLERDLHEAIAEYRVQLARLESVVGMNLFEP